MAYCNVRDVEALTQMSFLESSGRPTSLEVEAIIENVASELDGVAQAAGYTVPVTGTSAVALMKRYNVLGAGVEVWHAGHVTEIDMPRVEYWEHTYTAFLARLRRGEQQLPDEDPTSDLDPVFDIVQHPPRDKYLSGEDEPL